MPCATATTTCSTGRKHWITNAGVSDYYTVFAKTDPEAGHRGISAFVVESSFPGFSIGKLEHKLGVRGSPTGEVVLDDCVVPGRRTSSARKAAASRTRWVRSTARGRSSARRRSASRRARSISRAQYVQERSQFGRRIADFQGVQFMLADMATQVDAARLLVYRACARLDAGRTDTAAASSMGKLFASDTAMRVATDCVQLLGGVGYTKDMPAERFMRDAKITQIYEGTNQIQRIVIAKRLLEA